MIPIRHGKKVKPVKSKILVVDDEKDIVDLIAYNLEKEGFTPLKAFDGEEAIKLAEREKPQLIILDLMLPKIQGMQVCKIIRGNTALKQVPIIMLTAKDDEVDKILGLEMGADDYITKPFSVKELMARIRAVLRRYEQPHRDEDAEIISYKNIEIDLVHHTVSTHGTNITLSPTEFKLLVYLARHPGRVYSRNQLLDAIWRDEAFVEPRTVDVHIRRLRSQIEKDPTTPQYIFTVRGFGYKFADID